nr:hypothetical protein CFP56_09140 [Quercus suber]
MDVRRLRTCLTRSQHGKYVVTRQQYTVTSRANVDSEDLMGEWYCLAKSNGPNRKSNAWRMHVTETRPVPRAVCHVHGQSPWGQKSIRAGLI